MVNYKPLYKPEEAAEVLGCGKTKVYALIKKGDLISVIVGEKGSRIRGKDLEEYINNLHPQEVMG